MDLLTAHMPTLHPGATARILYVNAHGATSERTVAIERRFTSRDGVTYLRAYCHLRGEDRTFRLDRVLAVFDAETPSRAPEPPRAVSPATVPPPLHGPGRRERVTTTVAARPRNRPGHGSRVFRALFVGALLVIGVAWFRSEAPTGTHRMVRPPAPPVAVATTAEPERTREDALTRLFADADRDRDGSLSWAEIQAFQNLLDDRYRYISNGIALQPSQFIEAGGGDCEDWALMTASLLHFWGVKASVGLVESDTGVHAVALVPVSTVPTGFLEITLAHGATKSPRTYVPIDYTRVGGLSNAVGRSYTVTRVWRPDEIFGTAM